MEERKSVMDFTTFQRLNSGKQKKRPRPQTTRPSPAVHFHFAERRGVFCFIALTRESLFKSIGPKKPSY